MSPRVALLSAVLALAAAADHLRAASPQSTPSRPAEPRAVLTQYCLTCHNERLKTGGLVIDPAQAADPSSNAEAWEKIVRKLREHSMPPAGVPRPDDATYAAVSATLAAALDAAAAAHPQFGRLSPVHRLTRTEYRNAIRDLLDLDDLPKEISVDYLVPPDNVSSGFDTIADLLFVSPSAMERYLDAARKISRVAVGDPTMPVLVNIHKIDEEQPQDERVDDLPFGTRGGIAVRSHFPVDATYTIKVELASAVRDAHQLELSIDGARVKLESIGGDGNSGRRGQTPTFEFPLPIAAGPHLVGVTFIQHSEARDEATLRPRLRSRGTLPAIAAVTVSGPYSVVAPGDSPSRRRIFVCHPRSADEETPCAKKILSALAHRAYRRPVTQQDLDDLLPFFDAGRTESGFEGGVERALQRMLVSSHFLFRVEHPPANAVPGSTYRVSDLDLASQVSFFLWSSVPDDALLALAEQGRLSDPKVLDQQIRRMLADRRADALVTNFAAQWLYLRDVDAKHPDEILFPDFDETLRDAMRRETELFIGSVVREHRSVLDLLTANYTFVNERLARHYGIPNVKGSYFRRVTLPPGSVRGGLLGQGSVLTITSYANRTSPVLRGKWVLENLLSAAPPPPPANVPALKTEGAEPGRTLTMREAMTRHRAAPACAGCHARMDPIGFAMENFDAVGRWRETDEGSAIDTTGVFPDGTRFQGIDGLKQALVRHPEEFVDTVAERLLMYALGRNLQYYDAPFVRGIVRSAAANRYTFASLVSGVITSRPFLERRRNTE